MEYNVKGRVFLITGAATGLGAGFSERFLKEGAKHIAIFDVAAEAGAATVRRLNEAFGVGSASFLQCDVTDEAALTEGFRHVVNEHKSVDVVINNAGILDDSPRNFRRANSVNWQAVTTLSMLARDHMRTDRGGAGGTIVNISSVSALAVWPCLPIYSGAKAAVLLFSSCLGMEENYSGTKVRVLCISFGATCTPLMEHVGRKCMDQEMGELFGKLTEGTHYQRVESAVSGMVEMVKRGASGSAWICKDDKPARDMTHRVRAAYVEIAKE